MSRTTKQTETLAAYTARCAADHLLAIGWRPEQGTSDEALGLGDSWGGEPEGMATIDWSRRMERAVRALAEERAESFAAVICRSCGNAIGASLPAAPGAGDQCAICAKELRENMAASLRADRGE